MMSNKIEERIRKMSVNAEERYRRISAVDPPRIRKMSSGKKTRKQSVYIMQQMSHWENEKRKQVCGFVQQFHSLS